MTTLRRRGTELEQAIYAAVRAELSTVGYAALTMEGVAKRAQTGKAALYRRWPAKRDLILDALLHTLPDPRTVAASGSARDALIAALTIMSNELSGRTGFPSFDVMVELLREPEFREAFNAKVIEPRLRLIQAMLNDDDGLIAQTGPALVLLSFLRTGKAPTRAAITRIVDTILLPLLGSPTR